MFVVVALSSAGAGWALIERSETTPKSTVRAQMDATVLARGPRLDPSAPTAGPMKDAIPVLAYGPIEENPGPGELSASQFAAQLDALDVAGFETVTLDEAAALVTGERPDLPDRPVLITVDGTHQSAWSQADPLIASHGFEAVAFIDPALVVDHTTSARLTWDEVRALEASGRWAIGLGHNLVLVDGDETSPGALRSALTEQLARAMSDLGYRLDGHPRSLAFRSSGPGATEAVFQAGRVAGDDVDLVFTAGGSEVATRYWTPTSVPRIDAQGLDGDELLDRITAALPPTPEGLDAPPDPDAPAVVVSLSWDDGRSSVYRSLAIQERHGFEATYFINSDQIGGSGYYLSRGELDELAAAGNEIGGHTEGHVNLTEVSPGRARASICDDRSTLVDWYGSQAGVSFAYPFGSNASVADLVSECGYRSGRITSGLRGPLGCGRCPAAETLPPTDPYAIAASGSVRADWTLADLQRLVLQAEEAGGGWVNYVLHALSSSTEDRYAIAPETYDALLGWLADRPNVTVVTIGEVVPRPLTLLATAKESEGRRP